MPLLPAHWFPSPAFGSLLNLCFFGWALLECGHHLIGKGGRLGQAHLASDGGSYWLLVVTVYLCFCLAYLERFFSWGVATGASQYMGLALMLAGIAFREWAIVVLGRQFSVVVTIEANHHLVTHGPYRWLRHPAYTGGLIATAGFTLALGSLLMLLPVVVLLLLAFSYRIRREEKLLLTTFGSLYGDYMARTWRLLPGW
ncbi:MAG: isoprenylcysteine carboxylmethyltransferase family protein [Anaerolineae bacterium]|nr:isoprenylcysteine carboxylmethyltransferase family protein [Anaerolineae bacterium]